MAKKHGTAEENIAAAYAILGDLATCDAPIGSRTTYRVGGAAALSVVIDDELALEQVIEAVSQTGVELLVLGNGSNLLVSDHGFAGLCVTLGGQFAEIAIDTQRAAVQAGGGAAFPVVARQTAKAGLRGMEWAVGIPGSVGGAVAMNAGGHGADTAQRLVSAHVIGLDDRTNRNLTPRELNLGYRRSVVSPFDLVLSATFFLEPGNADEAEEELSSIVRWRREHQPGGRNAGSIFRNPTGDAAGRLIDAAGLKGRRCGSAAVSEKHANFIQVDENGSADDVYALIEIVRAEVEHQFGIELVPEVRCIGFGSNG